MTHCRESGRTALPRCADPEQGTRCSAAANSGSLGAASDRYRDPTGAKRGGSLEPAPFRSSAR
jgi:hypothetical protein